MAIFKFKKTKIYLDAFTDVPGVFHHAPIQRSSKFLPQWWKDLPKTFEEANSNNLKIEFSTMKACQGFKELYKTGFVIPMWSDLLFERNPNNGFSYQFSADITASPLIGTPITIPNQQAIGTNFNGYVPIKIIAPWLVREKDGINFFLNDLIWNKPAYGTYLRILPGMIDFKYQMGIHANAFLSTAITRFEIPYNEPLMQAIPISDKDIDIKCHLVDNNEIEKMFSSSSYRFSFKNIYNKLKKTHGDKCPFENIENIKSKNI